MLLQNTTAAIADNGTNKQIVYLINRVLYWLFLQSLMVNDDVAVDRNIRFVDGGMFAMVVVLLLLVHVAVDVRNCNILFTWKLNQRNNSHAIALPDIVVGRSPLFRSRVRSWSVDSELEWMEKKESVGILFFFFGLIFFRRVNETSWTGLVGALTWIWLSLDLQFQLVLHCYYSYLPMIFVRHLFYYNQILYRHQCHFQSEINR